ncbi:hypothetical protein HK102_008072, partial [Quaeritorhiza haematococci]
MGTSPLTDFLSKLPTFVLTYTPHLIFIFIFYRLYVKPFITPLQKLPGPTFNPLLALGALPTVVKKEAGVPQLRWAKEYGGIY